MQQITSKFSSFGQKKKLLCQTVSEDQESRSSSARWFRLRLPQEDAVTDSSSLSTGQREQFLTTRISPSQLSSPRASHETERERKKGKGKEQGRGKEKKEIEKKIETRKNIQNRCPNILYNSIWKAIFYYLYHILVNWPQETRYMWEGKIQLYENQEMVIIKDHLKGCLSQLTLWTPRFTFFPCAISFKHTSCTGFLEVI